MAASADRCLNACSVECRGLVLRQLPVSNSQWSASACTHCREGAGSEVVGFVNGILAIVDVSGTMGINLVRRTSSQR
jgi:hypothetical protein